MSRADIACSLNKAAPAIRRFLTNPVGNPTIDTLAEVAGNRCYYTFQCVVYSWRVLIALESRFGWLQHSGGPGCRSSSPRHRCELSVLVTPGPVYAHPGAQMARLERLRLLHKVAVGYYVVVPQDRIGTDWRPTIEATAAGIATAAIGAGQVALMVRNA